ncbi:MAG: O-antigen ligase family protein [Prolixibacteraceae bacterium]
MRERWVISLTQAVVYVGLVTGLFLVVYLNLHVSVPLSILLSIMPIGFLVLLFLLKIPYLSFLLLFTVNYFIMGVTRYVPGLMGGVLIDALVALVFLGIYFTSFKTRWPWENLRNGLTVVVSVWAFFCILTVLNPEGPFDAWIIGVRRTSFYFFSVPILTFLLFNRYKDLKIIILIWSVFVLLAIAKALVQKYTGFDAAENRWLFIEGKARTHILSSGIRYFSFFTDAANFGCGMAFSMVFFSIVSFYKKNKALKIYFFAVALAAAYGVLISGTRAAIVIPFAGFAVFAVLSKNLKVIMSLSIVLISAFVFLNFTTIGQGNSYIRRMRTTFHTDKDPSFIVRLENQKVIRTYLADKPFGVGIGTAKAQEYSTSEISKIPTDSWLVMIWVETGIVGLILYLSIIGYILARGSYIIIFRIKNREIQVVEGAFLSAIFGIFVASYANEVVAQFPNGPIIYMGMAFIFMSERYDQQLEQQKSGKIPENAKTD